MFRTEAQDQDGDVPMQDSSELKSKRYMESLSKSSRRVDIAEIKLHYEEILESKNKRINSLEQKNTQFL